MDSLTGDFGTVPDQHTASNDGADQSESDLAGALSAPETRSAERPQSGNALDVEGWVMTISRPSTFPANETVLDPLSQLFGATEKPTPVAFDLSLGTLRGVPALDNLWNGLELSTVTLGLSEYPMTQGPADLRTEFARVFEAETLSAADSDCFVATHGALDALGHVLAADGIRRVIYPMPGFDVGVAARRSSVPTHPVPWDIGGTISELLDQLDRALDRRHGGDAIVVNFPSNPSGASPTEAEWWDLISLADDAGAILVIDDVYRFSGPVSVRPISDAEHVVIVDSVSKRLGLPGLRIGSILARGPLLGQVRSSVAAASVGVSVAAAALATFGLRRYGDDSSIGDGIRRELDRRRRVVRAALSPEGLESLVLADAGLYGCLRFETPEEEISVGAKLREQDVHLTPGAGLSDGHPVVPFLRFCIGASGELGAAFELVNSVLERVRS
jgi:aspartate/methionine/tyrosine aminotransferase